MIEKYEMCLNSKTKCILESVTIHFAEISGRSAGPAKIKMSVDVTGQMAADIYLSDEIKQKIVKEISEKLGLTRPVE